MNKTIEKSLYIFIFNFFLISFFLFSDAFAGNNLIPIFPNQSADDSLFTDSGIWLMGISNGMGDWGDYDNDGDLDLLLTGGGGNATIYKNNLNSDSVYFTNTNAGLAYFDQGTGKWGDYDNDGDLDILLTGNSLGFPVSIIYKNVNGAFTNINAGLTGVRDGCGIWGDFDNDGDLDILLTGNYNNGGGSKIYRNENGAFTLLYSLTNSGYVNAETIDYDNDGDLDIFLTGNSTTSIYRNDKGIFTNTNTNLIWLNFEANSDWGDFDNDGDLDILLTGNSNFGPVSQIYRNNNGLFANINAPLSGIYNGCGVWGDFDNDSDLDILITGSSPNGYTSLLYKNNNGSFTSLNTILPGVSSSYADWADFDNDGDLDILLTGNNQFSNISKIFSNNTDKKNLSPSAPTELKMINIQPGYFAFSWSAAVDDITPQSGLSYNLYLIKNDQDTIQTVPSDISTGYNKVNKPGRIQGLTTRVANLGSGTYKWGIQAVDAGLKGGVFASSEFTLPNQAPGLPEIKNPQNGYSVFADSVYLKWKTEEYDGDSLFFNVFFGREGEMRMIYERIAINSVLVKDLEPAQEYFWQIKAYDKYNLTTDGPVWRFSTALAESEPNNSYSEADSIFKGYGYTGNVGGISDKEDYISIQLPYNALLTVKVENLNDSGLVNGGLGSIYLYHHSLIRNIIDYSNLDAGEKYTSGKTMVFANEKCFIKISSRIIDDIVPYRITFIIDFPSITDIPEPNNYMQTAYPLFNDSISSYAGFWGDDADWYKVSFRGNGTFKVKITDISDNYTVQNGLGSLKVYSPSGVFLTQISDFAMNFLNGESRETGLIKVDQGQSYFINVSQRDSSSAAAYLITIISSVQELQEGWGPTVPEPVNIPDGSIKIMPGDTTLKWSCIHPLGESVYYDLYLGSVSSPPLIADSLTVNEWLIKGMEPRDTVFWKVVAHDQNGKTTSSSVYKFVVSRDGYFIDPRDGNIYGFLTIGKQTWMSENLAYLPAVSPGSVGSGSSENLKYYYVYGYEGNDVFAAKATKNYQKYGVLYNWPAAMNGKTTNNENKIVIQGACPAGWHLPSYPEWNELETYLTENKFGYGGSGNDIAKSLASSSGWNYAEQPGAVGNKQELNNSSSLSMLPSGFRDESTGNIYFQMGMETRFWSSYPQGNELYAYSRSLNTWNSNFNNNNTKRSDGYSVRCIRDKDYISTLSLTGNPDFSYNLANSGNVTRTILLINKGKEIVPVDSLSTLRGPYIITSSIKSLSPRDTIKIIITLGTNYQTGTYTDTLRIFIENQSMSLLVNSIITNNIPPFLSLVSPADNARDVDTLGLKLNWSCTDREGEAVLYDVYFGSGSNPVLVSSGQNALSWQAPMLSPESEYSWFVIAKDSYGNISRSDTIHFTTWTNDPPTLEILAPEDKSTEIPVEYNLRWIAHDDENENIKFDIYFGTSVNPVIIESGYSQSVYKVKGLLKNTRYYWKVRAMDTNGNSIESALHSFTTTIRATGWINIRVTDSGNKGIPGVRYSVGIDNFIEGNTDTDGYSGQVMLFTGVNKLTINPTGYFGHTITNLNIFNDQLTTINIVLPKLGDYNSDGNTDQTDIDSLVMNWRNKNFRYELGPGIGILPDFMVWPDGILDFEDLMVFGMVWDYNNVQAKSKGITSNSQKDLSNLSLSKNLICTTEYDNSSDNLILNFKGLLHDKVISNKLIILYDNSALQYEGYIDHLNQVSQTICLANNDPDKGYLELITGMINEVPEGQQELVSVKFIKKSADYKIPSAIYEIHKMNSKTEKGIVIFDTGNDIKVYPNPARDKVSIETGDSDLPAVLSIYNNNGTLIIQKNITEYKQDVEISNLSKGIYLFNVSANNRIYSKIIIKY